MPTFDLVPRNEAELKTASGKRAMIINEYIEYLNQLQDGQAGRLQPVEGEGIMTVRRRIGAAAKAVGKDLVIKRSGDTIYFWAADAPRRRRGRPRKKPRGLIHPSREGRLTP